jgi:hypothetical protein
MEKTQMANIHIKTSIYYKFLHCVFIKSNHDATKFQTEFNSFCEKYKITKKAEIYSLLEEIKDEKTYKKFTTADSYIIGYALLFVIYYLKNNNSIFYYLNIMLLLMKATCNAKFKRESMELRDDDIGDELIEKTIDNLERIDTLVNLTNDLQKITHQMNDSCVYEIETTITDDTYLQFILLSTNH